MAETKNGTAKVFPEKEVLTTIKCSNSLSVDLDVADYSTNIGKWYEKNICSTVQLVKRIAANVEKYNEGVSAYNEAIAIEGAPRTWLIADDPLKITYSLEDLNGTIVSIIGTEGYSRNLADLRETKNETYEWSNYWKAKGLAGEAGSGWFEDANLVEEKYASYSEKLNSVQKKAAKEIYEQLEVQLKLREYIGEAALELKELWEGLLETINDAIGDEIAHAGEGAGIGGILGYSDEETAAAVERAENNLELRKDPDEPVTVTDTTPPKPKKINFERRAFSEQCYLLAKIVDIAAHKKDVIDMTPPQQKKLPYYPDEEAGNASLMIEGDPYAFVNRLTQHGAQSAFFNMKTEEISALQPMIRLYKIIEDEGQKPLQQEFMFDSHASKRDVENLFNDTSKRGFGVGIKDFTFTYDGSTPFAAKKSIKAQLKIFASSFDELLVDRGGYMYADLALKTGKMRTSQTKLEEAASTSCQTIEDVQANLDKLNFRLKAVVGWARPSGDQSIFTTTTETGRRKVIDAINESYVTLNLTPTIHEFNIDDMGRVNFTINYLAYIEDFFDQSEFDIFYNRGVLVRQAARDLVQSTLSSYCDSSEKISSWKKSLAESGIIRKDKFKNMQSLMERLGAFGGKDEGKIRYINIGKEDLENYNREGPFYQSMNVAAAMKDRPAGAEAVSAKINRNFLKQVRKEKNQDKAQRSKITVVTHAAGPLEKTISFFYVSDLADIILKGIGERLRYLSDDSTWDGFILPEANAWKINEADQTIDDAVYKTFKYKRISKIRRFAEEYKKFRLLLGPLELVNPENNGERKEVSFGDIPVSTKYFMGWLSDKLIAKEQTQYNLSTFLKEFFNHIVRDFLNNDQCFTINTKQKAVLNEAIVTSYRDTKYDEITQWIISKPTGIKGLKHYSRAYAWLMSQPILNVSGPHGRNSTSPIVDSGVANEINYMIFSAARVQPKELQKGSRVQDEARGIFHYLIGRPRGIVKNINLVKHDSKYLKIVRFQQDGFDGLQQLREVYNAEIDCFANVKAFPGTYIFVDPRGFAPNTPYYAATDPTDPKPSSKRPNPMDLTQYGIGGYCMIYRSEHTFAPGKADSKITAAWVAAVDPDNEDCSPPEPSSTGDGSTEKACKKLKTPAPKPAAGSPAANPIGRAPNANFGIQGDIGISKL